MTELGQTPDMKGRTRLKGVLDGLVQQSKDEKDGEILVVDEDVEEGARDLLELNDEGGSFSVPRKRGRSARSPPTRRKGRKRMCKEVYQSPDASDASDLEQSHISHVMTLFDRRVDLARFMPDTPLYVMCREWMWNNPQKLPSSASSHDDHLKPLPPDQPSTFPPPTPLSRDTSGKLMRLDVPKPHPPHTNSTREQDNTFHWAHPDLNPDLSFLKSTHLERWRGIRNSWRHASLLNQDRYAQSFNTIRELFQR